MVANGLQRNSSRDSTANIAAPANLPVNQVLLAQTIVSFAHRVYGDLRSADPSCALSLFTELTMSRSTVRQQQIWALHTLSLHLFVKRQRCERAEALGSKNLIKLLTIRGAGWVVCSRNRSPTEIQHMKQKLDGLVQKPVHA